MDYKEIADQIIIAIGGQDNVKYVTPVSYTHLDVYKRQVLNTLTKERFMQLHLIP